MKPLKQNHPLAPKKQEVHSKVTLLNTFGARESNHDCKNRRILNSFTLKWLETPKEVKFKKNLKPFSMGEAPSKTLSVFFFFFFNFHFSFFMLLHSVYICNCASPAVLRLEPK